MLPDNVRQIVDVVKREVAAGSGPVTFRAGEPGIILRSADGKSVVGRLGTMPDGSMSLAVDTRGAVQDIRNVMAADRASITFLDQQRERLWATVEGHDARIAGNRSSITYLDNNKASNAALATEAARISYLDANKASNAALAVERSRISFLDNAKASNARVDSVANAASQATAQARAAEDRANQLLVRVERIEAQNLNNRVSRLERYFPGE